ncbi:hypothetical protein GQR58_013983 [Nymphon striatum]|nr:hypothetical protein GQR58_013983 [Nymphon striatum]
MTRGPAKLLSSVGVSDNELLSFDDHEEADTRLFAHVAYSAKEQGCRRAVISATDTDIVMLGQFHAVWLRVSLTMMTTREVLETTALEKQNSILRKHLKITMNVTCSRSSNVCDDDLLRKVLNYQDFEQLLKNVQMFPKLDSIIHESSCDSKNQ